MRTKNSLLTNSLCRGFVFFLSTAFLFVLYIRLRLIFVYYPDIGGVESNIIYSIQRFLSGMALFEDPEHAPFAITQYSPLYYRLLGFIGQAFVINPDDPMEVYRISRSLALVTNLIYMFMIFKIGRLFNLSFLKSMCVALMAFVLLPPQLYSRPDSVSTLLTVSVVYFMVFYINGATVKTKRLYLLLIVLLVSLAVTAKQSAIVLPAIVCSYILFFEKKIVKAFAVGLSMGALTVLLLFVIMPEHDLSLLYVNNVIGVKQGLDWGSYATNIFLYYFRTYALINAIGIFCSVWLISSEDKQNKWLGWFAISFFLFACLTSLKQGSALNYFNEFVSLSPIMGLVFLSKVDMKIPRQISALLLVVIGFWITAPNMINFTWKYAFADNSVFKESYIEQQRIRDYLKNDLGMSSSDRVFVTLHNYCFLNGLLYKNCILPQQEMVMVMYPKGDIDYGNLDREAQDGEVRFVVTQSGENRIKFPEKLALEKYEFKKAFNGFDVYELKKI
jgi:hypothetical protein